MRAGKQRTYGICFGGMDSHRQSVESIDSGNEQLLIEQGFSQNSAE